MRTRRARRQLLVAGFVLQILTGALTWPGRCAWERSNLGVALPAAWPAGEWVFTMGWWLASLGLGSFVPLAAAALIASHLRTEEAT
jgi:hypothetical protein